MNRLAQGHTAGYQAMVCLISKIMLWTTDPIQSSEKREICEHKEVKEKVPLVELFLCAKHFT